jgi:hypothetical protein
MDQRGRPKPHAKKEMKKMTTEMHGADNSRPKKTTMANKSIEIIP